MINSIMVRDGLRKSCEFRQELEKEKYEIIEGMRNEIRRLHGICQELQEEKGRIIEAIRYKEWAVRQEYTYGGGERRLKEVKMDVLQDLMFELGIEPREDNE